MRADSADDLILAQQAAAGDEAALKALYARYADPLFVFIYHQLDRAHQEAEEVWQDTLLAAFRSLGTYHGQSHMFTWMCGIARHKVADWYRRNGRPGRLAARVSPQELAALVDGGPLPEEALMQQAIRTVVAASLGTIPLEYRQVLVARYVEGRRVDEIARSLGKTYKATESLLSRARAAFREVLTRLDREDDLG